ncbi:holin [Gordonia rubripertincta]|uniref:Holin n=1 Tax=Gordonia rubripertincta TaxID=36822 RepID=A0AAW4GBQ5_GORRU|nr:holin [Gordonia rubripertincta]MBM7280376.1 holin [Gordonia rubripertincta]
MFTKLFWADAVERAVKTAAQSAIGVFVADTTILSLDWEQAGGIVGTAALVSVLTSIASKQIGTPGTASAVPTPTEPPAQ